MDDDNLLLDQLFGAELVTIPDRALHDQTLQNTFNRAIADGRKPYLVPYGGSSPTGALGYAYAVQEFMQQNVHADWIIFATSSGGTHAGLVLGQRVFGYKGKVLGISIDEPEQWLKNHVSRLASDASEKLGERIEFTCDDILANENYCQAGYGVLTDAEREAVQLFAKHEGLLLDPVYTGRAADGMIDLIRRGFFKRNETILFWHTDDNYLRYGYCGGYYGGRYSYGRPGNPDLYRGYYRWNNSLYYKDPHRDHIGPQKPGQPPVKPPLKPPPDKPGQKPTPPPEAPKSAAQPGKAPPAAEELLTTKESRQPPRK